MLADSFTIARWLALIALDLLLAKRLLSLYKKDSDIRKQMFAIGVLLCIPVYAIAIVGFENSTILRNIFNWSPLPILVAFTVNLLNERLNFDLKKGKQLFLLGTGLAFLLFMAPIPLDSLMFLLVGVIFASIIAIIQYSSKFEVAPVVLFLSMPCFSICFVSIEYGIIELALFAGFAAKLSMILAFEVAKRYEVAGSSILVLQEKLNTAEENFSKLFSILPDPAVIVDSKGNFLEITTLVSELTGYQKEELVGSNFMTSRLVTARSKAILIKNLAKRMLGFHIAPYEIEIHSKEGKPMQFEINAMKIEYNGKPADMVIFRDLTERHRLLRNLQQEQERFQSIAESTGDWIWEIDFGGRFTYSNSVVQRILGYSPEAVIGMKYCDFSPNEIGQEEKYFKVFRENMGGSVIKHCLRLDKEIVLLETRGVPVFGATGAIVGYRGADRDITEKKRMEDMLLKSERLVAIGHMATMVAHDLRNPLQSIATTLYCLRHFYSDSGNERTHLLVQKAEAAVSQSDRIIRDLLDYSSKISLELIKTNPRAIVEKSLAGTNIPNRIELINRANEKPKIPLDISRMERVIVNIVLNAFDAMPNGGTLTIESRQKKGFLELSFRDTGIGISKEKIDKLWTPFVTTKAKGMGLGLPICKRFVEAHGGHLLVETEENKGTVFTLVLPLGNNTEAGNNFLVGRPAEKVSKTTTHADELRD